MKESNEKAVAAELDKREREFDKLNRDIDITPRLREVLKYIWRMAGFLPGRVLIRVSQLAAAFGCERPAAHRWLKKLAAKNLISKISNEAAGAKFRPNHQMEIYVYRPIPYGRDAGREDYPGAERQLAFNWDGIEPVTNCDGLAGEPVPPWNGSTGEPVPPWNGLTGSAEGNCLSQCYIIRARALTSDQFSVDDDRGASVSWEEIRSLALDAEKRLWKKPPTRKPALELHAAACLSLIFFHRDWLLSAVERTRDKSAGLRTKAVWSYCVGCLRNACAEGGFVELESGSPGLRSWFARFLTIVANKLDPPFDEVVERLLRHVPTEVECERA
ncbi:MAG: MarR family winged helix-turn-helix transcriptional regulator [Thermoguttaceae bacterium]